MRMNYSYCALVFLSNEDVRAIPKKLVSVLNYRNLIRHTI